ncbi:Mediator of RNA polymerase II transcription subunit 7 [Aphelenchoides fujianensis]|nr:Mediator of RNA polymerase II transcription subunit 7 [Aphelenchoides fujianensis]
MAGAPGGQQNAQIVSVFPDPPEFAHAFSAESLAKGEAPKPPPIPRKFVVFGEETDLESRIVQSLSEQLYSSTANWKSELKKLNRSVVAAFLDLLEILIKSPDHPERLEKLETIRLLFINMHHLINEYRPVQARDTLRHIMVKQNKEIKAVNEKLRTHLNTSMEVFKRIHETFSTAFYDPSLIRAPEALTNPPEFDRLTFESRKNADLPPDAAENWPTWTKEEDESDGYSETEIADDTSKSSDEEVANEEMEEELYGQNRQEVADFDDRSSSDSSLGADGTLATADVNVEYMEEDDDSDEGGGGRAQRHRGNGIRLHEEPDAAVEKPADSPADADDSQEPPAELVDDAPPPADGGRGRGEEQREEPAADPEPFDANPTAGEGDGDGDPLPRGSSLSPEEPMERSPDEPEL